MLTTIDNPIPPALALPGDRKGLKPHPEWAEHRRRWRWMLDSYEAGEVYREATYGHDVFGLPIRNLVRHKREYPLGSNGPAYSLLSPASAATDDPYEMRRARTSVPTYVKEAVEVHLSKIYNREITREGPKELEDWWKDVDGAGTTIDQWMKDQVAPLLMTLGQLDRIFDRPAPPDGEEVKTRADEIRLGLDSCVGSYILPENLPWWRVDRRGRYLEALVREVGDDGATSWVHWDAETWTRYDDKGKAVAGPVEHGYGVVPIVRDFDRRRLRCRNVGWSRYEGIAEYQKDAYNRESELIVSDTTQAQPTLLVPESYNDTGPNGESEVPVGASYSLPIVLDKATGTVLEPKYMEPPKGAAESLRLNIANIRDAADRDACLTKPAGAAGTDGRTVAQSGVSKRIDQNRGDELLGAIAKSLQRMEENAALMVLRVRRPGVEPDLSSFSIIYPTEFDLSTPEEKLTRMELFGSWLATAGDCPKTQLMMAGDFLRDAYRGLDDETYAEFEGEIEEYLAKRGEASDEGRVRDAEALLGRLAMNRTNQPAAASGDAPGDPQADEESA